MRGALKLLTAATVAMLVASCGGGGGGGGGGSVSAGYNEPQVQPEPVEPVRSYKVVNGTITDESSQADVRTTTNNGTTTLLSQIKFICAVYDDNSQFLPDVPVRENCVPVNNGTFTLPVWKENDYALFFFDDNNTPLGYVGDLDNVATVHLGDKDVNLQIALRGFDDKGQVYATFTSTDGEAVSFNDQFFNSDDDGDGIPNPVDIDYIRERFVKYKIVPVKYLQKAKGLLVDDVQANDELTAEHYYYLFIDGQFQPYGLDYYSSSNTYYPSQALYPIEVNEGSYTKFYNYLMATNSEGVFDDNYTTYNVLDVQFHVYGQVMPVYVSAGWAYGVLSPEEFKDLRDLVLYAIQDWNSVIHEVNATNGFIYLGAMLPLQGRDTVEGWPFPKASTRSHLAGGVVVTYAQLSGTTTGLTQFGGVQVEVNTPFTVTVNLDNGTQVVSKYWNNGLIINRLVKIGELKKEVVVHEFGHVLDLDHPFASGCGNIPSVMNYYDNGAKTEDISDFDSQLVQTEFQVINDYGVDPYQSAWQSWIDFNSPVSILETNSTE